MADLNGSHHGLRWITDFAFLPDSSRMVLAADDPAETPENQYKDRLVIYSIPENRVVRTIPFTRALDEIAVNPKNGQIAVAAGADKSRIMILEPADFSIRHDFAGHEGPISLLCYTRDGQCLVSGGFRDNTVALWDAHTGRLLWRNAAHTSWITSAAYSRQKNILITAQAFIARNDSVSAARAKNKPAIKSTARAFDLQTGRYLGPLHADAQKFNQSIRLAFSPDGKILYGAAGNPTHIYVWDIRAH